MYYSSQNCPSQNRQESNPNTKAFEATVKNSVPESLADIENISSDVKVQTIRLYL